MRATLNRILRALVLLGVIATAASPVLAQLAVQSYSGHDAAANEVLIKFREATPDEPQAQAAIAASVRQLQATADIDVARGVGSAGWLLWHSRSNDVATLMGLLTNAADVVGVEPIWIYRVTSTPNDPYFSNEWGLQNTGQVIQGVAGTPGADIGAAQAWNISTGSSAIVVGVVDTGIDYNHPDLAANVWAAPTQYSFYQGSTQYTCPAGTHGWNTFSNACDPLDDNDHGTHVSGTIGAAANNGVGVAGVNWTASIIAAKMCNAAGSCPTSNAINALQFLEGAKAAFGGKGGAADIRVLNNSWGGGGFSQALLDEINNTNTADMLFAAAAGNYNSNNDTYPFYPASYNAPNIIAVAATDNQDQLANFGGGYASNYGANSVDLGAPGKSVYSTVRWSDNPPYQYFSGTSMATPHVVGTAALSEAVCQFDTDSLKPNLLNNVVQIPSLQGKTVTGGRVNAYRSLSAGSTACPGTGYGTVSGFEKQKTIPCSALLYPCHMIIYDSGTVTIAVNGVNTTVRYGQGSTKQSVAAALYSAINGDGTYPARAHLSGSNVSLSAKRTGSDTCYALSASSTTDDPGDFGTPSFRVSVSGGTLAGCR